jgi:hypothetical protein
VFGTEFALIRMYSIALAGCFLQYSRMSKKAAKISERDVGGLKYFRKLRPMLKRLHECGVDPNRPNKRQLHYDDYCMLVLLYLFNPTVSSLRAIQQASELKKVQKKLGCSRASLGSLSESSHVFDPDLLKEIIAELGQQLQPVGADKRLASVKHTLTLVDGSLLSFLPEMAKASFLKSESGSGLIKWRLHTHFEVDKYVPTRIEATEDGGGPNDERAVMERMIDPDKLYVMDRGYAKFTLFNKIVACNSSYVCRLRDNSKYQVTKRRELSDEAKEARVLEDLEVEFGATSNSESKPDHPMRLVTIEIKPHVKKTKYKGGKSGHNSDGILRIGTNLMDVPAEAIALIYHYRWTIEIFFSLLQTHAGLSPPHQPPSQRYRDPMLLRDHWMHAD